MNNLKPQITVLMSVYNGEKYVVDAVESVLSQTFNDFEFLIFEDCSKDNSLSILREYAKKDSRINLIANETNQGLTANLIQGMNIAKGTYLARMDADDICLPERFEEQVAYLNKHQDISLLGSSVIFFDDSGYEFIGYQPLAHDQIKVELLLGYTMMHPSVMMRLGDFRKHNLNYDITFRYSQDFDLWVRAIRKLNFMNLSEPLLKMREHASKISRTVKPDQKRLSDRRRESQLKELGVQLSTEEIRLFNSRGSMVTEKIDNEVKLFEQVLLKIIEANKGKSVFNESLLESSCALRFRDLCREKLISGDKSGLYYWRSSLKEFDNSTSKSNLGLVYRSLKSFFVKSYN